jgi:glycosyltransferase involved in cell wall biosynthesis
MESGSESLRIAQVSPLYESVPPKYYGGTERIVSYLTEALVKEGHDVTLFASGDSKTSARLIAPYPQALRLTGPHLDNLAVHVLMLETVRQHAWEFDVIHFHIDYLHFPLSRAQQFRQVTTLHGRLDCTGLDALYREFGDMPVVSISNAQRSPLPEAYWLNTVYHGLPKNLYSLGKGQGGYLAFVGRISPEKQVDHAIEIARQRGMRIRIAAKIDPNDRDYYDKVKHLLKCPHVDFLGEIGEPDKEKLLQDAAALLFPIDWPEPFGLVMIEAMACGTPVIAYRRGSVPEILTDGVTGYIVDGIEEAVQAVDRIESIDRGRCRDEFLRRFTASRMAKDYVALYQKLLKPIAVT